MSSGHSRYVYILCGWYWQVQYRARGGSVSDVDDEEDFRRDRSGEDSIEVVVM